MAGGEKNGPPLPLFFGTARQAIERKEDRAKTVRYGNWYELGKCEKTRQLKEGRKRYRKWYGEKVVDGNVGTLRGARSPRNSGRAG